MKTRIKLVPVLLAVMPLLFQSCSDEPDKPENPEITTDFDPTFAAELQRRGYVSDAQNITLSEVKDIIDLDVSGTYESPGQLSSLKGIEHFKSLEVLDCNYNQITSLDVSNNTQLRSLICNGNQLTSLDVGKNTQLTILYCNDNKLTSLDVSKNTQLCFLTCNGNQLTALDFSKNTLLTYITCWANQLTSLDVSKNINLTELLCDNNKLTSLDISKNTQLTSLWCHNNPGENGLFKIKCWFNPEQLPDGFTNRSWTFDGINNIKPLYWQ